MGRPRQRRHTVVFIAQVGDQALHGGEQAGGDGPRHPRQRLEGAVHRVGPGAQVSTPGGLALLGGRVLPVVAGQVQVLQVQERTSAVLFELPVDDSCPLLEGPEMSLDHRIGHGRPAKAGERTSHSARREVLHHAVIVVKPDGLPGLGDEQLADRPKPPVHRRPRYRQPPRSPFHRQDAVA